MKLEAGKRYVTIGGSVTSKLEPYGEGFQGKIGGTSIYWYANGKVRLDNITANPRDEISHEYHVPLTPTQPHPLTSSQKNDPVNPTHYTSGSIECIDAMEAMLSLEEFRGFLRGNSFKYRWRYRQKNGVEDLKKAMWYEERLLKLEEKENEPRTPSV
jgi:hypothetical protein